MHKSKQILVVVLVVALMGALLAQPIKGLVKKDSSAGSEHSGNKATGADKALTTYETVSKSAKEGLSNNISAQITELEDQLASTPKEGQLTLLKSLADRWNDVNKLIPLGFTYEKIAGLDPSVGNWVKTGNTYTDASQNLPDTSLARELNTLSIQAYEQALKLQPANLDAKTGLGIAYVNGGASPMAGISLLLEVVKSDPTNLKANKSLGLFSMQSRQFDKAIARFKTVLSVNPDEPESWFYLATSYENIGLKKEAIEAFEKSKKLASDPSLSQFIDRKIAELSK
ncbi:Cytochrome c-type biogenesis protein CcmH/NrfG [bacterium A37T11]|nr:Cytochrome c-type biogenesis protein CcmH/NrfG [bacterium A37T11]